jgi:hypothetical protein
MFSPAVDTATPLTRIERLFDIVPVAQALVFRGQAALSAQARRAA